MTCEIAIMNRYAIALAADSATTVTHYVGTERKERYFKGANKIFQLTNHAPVGIMIFGTATLHEAPWELIVKEFRGHLGDKSFNDLEGYAAELFDFIRGHERLFPADYQEKVFREEANKVAFLNIFAAQADAAVQQATDKTAAYHDFLTKRLADIAKMPLYDGFTQDDLDAALARHKPALEGELQPLVTSVNAPPIDLAQLAEVAIRALLTELRSPHGVDWRRLPITTTFHVTPSTHAPGSFSASSSRNSERQRASHETRLPTSRPLQ